MIRYSPLFLLLLAGCGSPAPAEKPLYESWHAAYFEGLRVGHVHTVASRVGVGDKANIRTRREMELTIKRYGSTVPVILHQTSDETAAGEVLAMSMTQQIGTSAKATTNAVVEGKTIVITPEGAKTPQKLPFPPEALGLFAQEKVFSTAELKPGKTFAVTTYELLLPGPMVIDAKVMDAETVDRLELKTVDGKEVVARTPAKLVRVEATPRPVKLADGTEAKLPGKTTWVDGKGVAVREQFEMPGFGVITMFATSKEAALKEGIAPDRLPDMGLAISIPVKQTIDEPYRTSRATYRVTLKEKMPTLFARDSRQVVNRPDEKVFDLSVRADRSPGTDDKAAPPGAEFLESSNFLDAGDTRLKRLAEGVAGRESDPWKKALLLEKWVHENMKVSTAVGFPNASQIAQDLEGDCRQHAMLLAAMCRAVGVPSRTAVGLIYVREQGRSPVFGFHMWSEVWVRGKWTALDAIVGQGGVGATHLKMYDQSWSRTTTLAPLLPVAQALGKIQIEVVDAR